MATSEVLTVEKLVLSFQSLRFAKVKPIEPIETVAEKIVSSFKSLGFTTDIVRVGRINYTSFNAYANALETKRNGDANVKYAWYAGTKDELKTILSNGFIYTFGAVSLSPSDLAPSNLCPADENGFRHMMLCRVILGNAEVVVPGACQYKPSSEEFDSGVDNLESPKKYTIWYANVKTHVLPEFVLSFRAPSNSRVCPRVSKPGTTHVSSIIKKLSKVLPADAVDLISKHQAEYNKGKISGSELGQRVGQVAGSEVLSRVTIGYLENLKRKKGHNEKDAKYAKELISQFSSKLSI